MTRSRPSVAWWASVGSPRSARCAPHGDELPRRTALQPCTRASSLPAATQHWRPPRPCLPGAKSPVCSCPLPSRGHHRHDAIVAKMREWGMLTYVRAVGKGFGKLPGYFDMPTWMCIVPDGHFGSNLCVVDSCNYRLQLINPYDGTVIKSVGRPGARFGEVMTTIFRHTGSTTPTPYNPRQNRLLLLLLLGLPQLAIPVFQLAHAVFELAIPVLHSLPQLAIPVFDSALPPSPCHVWTHSSLRPRRLRTTPHGRASRWYLRAATSGQKTAESSHLTSTRGASSTRHVTTTTQRLTSDPGPASCSFAYVAHPDPSRAL